MPDAATGPLLPARFFLPWSHLRDRVLRESRRWVNRYRLRSGRARLVDLRPPRRFDRVASNPTGTRRPGFSFYG